MRVLKVFLTLNKTNESCKCVICNCYHFLKVNFRFQSKLCDGCRDLMQNTMSFNDAAVFSLKGNDYKIIFW